MKENDIIIFTDGSSRGNPGPGGYGFLATYQSHGTEKVDEGGGGEKETTNNRMEMMAVLKALSFFDGYYVPGELKEKQFTIYLDSAYVMNGATKWVFGWQKNNWKTSLKEDVANVDLWQDIMKVMHGKKIEWKLLKGHAGIAGNERCDEIATAYADSFSGEEVKGEGEGGAREPRAPELFRGNLSDYGVDIMNLMGSGAISSGRSSKKSSKEKAYSYVSLVDGLVMTHQTWEECEARVKGAKGAKFKKVFSAGEETNLINTLGKL